VKFSNKLYLTFLATILTPGLILAYLSLGSIQHEKELILQYQNTQQRDFLAFTEGKISDLETSFLEQFEQLFVQSITDSVQNNFYLATDLLSSPVVKALVLLEEDQIIFPKKFDSSAYNRVANAFYSKEDKKITQTILHKIQQNYGGGNCQESIRWIHQFNLIPENKLLRGPLGNLYYYDLKLLELICYKKIKMYKEAIIFGNIYIDELLHSKQVASYQQLQFYLEEILSSLTSIEMLSREERDELWDLHSRTKKFFENAIWIERHWKPKGEVLSQLQGKKLSNGLQVFYLENAPYIKVQFPWIDSRYQIIIRINELYFAQQLRSEVQNSWKDVQYTLYNLDDVIIDSDLDTTNHVLFDSLETGYVEPDQERVLNTKIMYWKMDLFHTPDQNRLAVNKRKVFLLYTLLVFSSIVLVLGTIIAIRSLQKERRTGKMKSNFLSAVTHELKTPLTSIRLLSEMLSSGRQVNEQKVRKYAKLIGDESNRLQTLVEGVLDFAKLEQQDLSKSNQYTSFIDLEEVLEEAKSRLAESYAKKEISLVFKCKSAPQVLGKKEHLYSVVQNLLDNALKYSPRQTQVTVTLSKEKTGVLLSIQDQGVGISPSQQKLIFNRFYRVEDEMTRNTKGTGLGLALVDQILKQHQATVSIQSTLKEGATFNILFTQYKK
jgi:signal transduction histidine kinase